MWQSGRSRTPAKGVRVLKPFEGSNPSISAIVMSRDIVRMSRGIFFVFGVGMSRVIVQGVSRDRSGFWVGGLILKIQDASIWPGRSNHR